MSESIKIAKMLLADQWTNCPPLEIVRAAVAGTTSTNTICGFPSVIARIGTMVQDFNKMMTAADSAYRAECPNDLSYLSAGPDGWYAHIADKAWGKAEYVGNMGRKFDDSVAAAVAGLIDAVLVGGENVMSAVVVYHDRMTAACFTVADRD